jgi:PST family polysaccharide transporter
MAAYRLSGIFLNFILNAMGADFYPQLTAASSRHEEMRSLVNYQTEIGLLLAVPGLLATLVLAPWIITVFYTGAFAESAQLLQWLILGCLSRVVAWPLGYIMLAKGVGKIYLISEILTHIVHLCLIWVGLQWFGLSGVAAAFCAINFVYSIAALGISRYLIEFKWSASVKKLLFTFFPLMVGVLIATHYCSLMLSTSIGCLLIAAVGIYCLRELCSRLGPEHNLVVKLQMIPGANIITGI